MKLKSLGETRSAFAPASMWWSLVVTVTSRTRPFGSRTVSGTSDSSVPKRRLPIAI